VATIENRRNNMARKRKAKELKPLMVIYRSELINVPREAGYNIPDDVSFVANGGISCGENSGIVTDKEPLEVWESKIMLPLM
jgi:hypothetical protein